MRHTQHLFSYGTLQDVEVQKGLLNRKLNGKRNALLGYRLSDKKLMGKYPVIERSADESDCVNGTVFRVSYLELHTIDQYETYMYKRIRVTLKSGIKAWAYVENLN